MDKLYRVNLIYSIVIIAAGIFGILTRYYEQGDWKFTALIPAAFGLILISMTGGIRKHKRSISHLVVVLTFILAIMVTVMMTLNLGRGGGTDRKFWIFLLILVASLIALGYYIASFIVARRSRNNDPTS